MGNTSGRLFRVTTFGESHGPAIGAIVDGCPPGLSLDAGLIDADLARRRPGQSALSSPRDEPDRVQILSGVFEGRTTGTPIALVIPSADARSGDYESLRDVFRPGHADLAWQARFGHRDHRGGGRASARETAARVAAGAVARAWLRAAHGIEVLGYVDAVGPHQAEVDPAAVVRDAVEAHPTRCPDPAAAARFAAEIEAARADGDTVGGVVTGVARGVPAGWGAPVFDKIEAELARACLSLPACRGFEIGSGFAGARQRGSAHNDAIVPGSNGPRPATGRAGGTLGGITDGGPLVIRCAFKPVSSHRQPQQTVTTAGAPTTLRLEGRHDPCVVPRAVPLVEAAMLLTLIDHALLTLALARPGT